MGTQADGGQAAVEWFGQLFADHYAGLYRFALRRTDSRQDAEDLVAEVFMVAWRRLAELPVGEETRLWLFGTARLILRNQWRGRRRRQHLVERLRRTATAEGSADRMAQPAEATTDVGAAMARLPDRDREVLLLAAWEGLASQEIAVVLDVTAETARKRLQRARTRLREALRPEDGSATSPTLAVRKAEP